MTLFLVDADINHFRAITPAEYLEGIEPSYDTLEFGRQFHDSRSMAENWSPIPLRYVKKGEPIGDFPAYGSTPVFSGRAVEVLRDLLEPKGELLPTICPTHELWIYKVLRFVDVLDLVRSLIDWHPQLAKDKGKPRRIERIRRYELIDDREPEAALFKIPQQPMFDVYVNSAFHDRVQEAGLLGFAFRQVWPTPDDSAARRHFLEKHRRKKGR